MNGRKTRIVPPEKVRAILYGSSLLLSGVNVDGIRFPRLSPIIGKRPFSSERGCGDVGVDDTHQDGGTVQGFLVEEFAAPFFELTDHRRCHTTVLTTCPIQAPLMRLFIVEMQYRAHEVWCRSVDFEFRQA